MISLIIVICKRRIQSYYLRWSLLILILANTSSIFMEIRGFIILSNETTNHSDLYKLYSKVNILSFVSTLYTSQMILVSLIFSAVVFYRNLRNQLYPQLMIKDSKNKLVKICTRINLKCYYYSIITILFICLWTYIILVFWTLNDKD